MSSISKIKANSFSKAFQSGVVGIAASSLVGSAISSHINDIRPQDEKSSIGKASLIGGGIGAGIGVASYRFPTLVGKPVGYVASSLVSGAATVGGGALGFAKSFIELPRKSSGKIDLTRTLEGDTKLTKFGKSMVAADVVVKSAKNAFNALNESRISERDGYTTNSTPRIPSYMNNGGATGDLVLAMHKLRNTGAI